MKLHARNLKPHVSVHREATRPILLRLAGLHLALTPTESRALADQLHDAADRSDER